ncbi:hypothetical protein [Neisseria chenwenguii]|nr:hypothetical protein [Neisseria chenwenguii]
MKAQCSCGAVSLKVEHDSHAHGRQCGMYRIQGGSAYFAVDAIGMPQLTGSGYIA